ncbi:putative PurR-regulated permease PerM [Shimia isoporae]|uniref:Putative PurR-regulated permease PerM n=1 Tax=Shimia isoporae TaxID=647720 RepID=A0A4R1N2Q9_9RHOB|nr:AI-2E family transporter [Shimia isoporae]TCK99741.1 putative PurR-regulated permease PerM [Shimia isoporae]
MERSTEDLSKALTDAFTASLIRFALIAFVLLVCTWVFAPFLPIMLWGIVLAVALYPAQTALQKRFGWSPGRAATVIVLIGIVLIGVPTWSIGNAFAVRTLEAYSAYEAGTLTVPAANPAVAEWPLIGEDLHAAWVAAATDLPDFLETKQPQLSKFASWVLSMASSTAGSVFQLIGALIIAGIMLAWAEAGTKSIRRILIGLSDAQLAPELHELATKTIRQVAIGIIGIAFITAIVFGIVAFIAGVPAAPLLTIIALLLAIMQVPVTLVALVAAGLLWAGDNSVPWNVTFTILLLAASMTDNFLKPMVLGRGLDVPMPVVLIGAIGGMMAGGILGMFIGAAFLSAGYQVFMKWVDSENQPADAEVANDAGAG